MIGRLSVAAVAIAGAIYGSERLADRAPNGGPPGLRIDARDQGLDGGELDEYADESRGKDREVRLKQELDQIPRAEVAPERTDGGDFNPRLAEALGDGGIFDEDALEYADIPHGDRGDPDSLYGGLRPEDRPSAEGDDLYDRGFEDGLRRSGYRRGIAREPSYLAGYRAGLEERNQRFADARTTSPAPAAAVRRPRAVAGVPTWASTSVPGAPPVTGLRACTGEAERRWGLPQGGAAVANARAGADGGQVVAVRASGRRAMCTVDASGRVQSLNEDG